MTANFVAEQQLKANLSELLSQVADGQEITIMREGTPVARLIPAGKKHTPEERKAAVQEILRLQKGTRLEGVTINELIETGRQ